MPGPGQSESAVTRLLLLSKTDCTIIHYSHQNLIPEEGVRGVTPPTPFTVPVVLAIELDALTRLMSRARLHHPSTARLQLLLIRRMRVVCVEY